MTQSKVKFHYIRGDPDDVTQELCTRNLDVEHAAMALWKSGEIDDEFFGKLDCESDSAETARLDDGHREDNGLMEAEEQAAKERFRILGYHEAYDKNKDARLQEGFESGYEKAYEVSVRIGKMLGKMAIESKLRRSSHVQRSDSQQVPGTSVQPDPYLEVVKCVRDFLSKEDGDKRLEELEDLVKEKICSLQK